MRIANNMKILNKMTKFTALLLIVLIQFIFIPPQKAYAATSPSLGAAASYSILGGTTVTNTGTTTVAGDLGVYAGSAVTGILPTAVGAFNGGSIHTADVSAQNAQAANTVAFLALSAAPNVDCGTTYAGTKDLTTVSPLVAGIYCADAFTLSGNLTLSGTGVWIFRSAATIITASGSIVTGGDPCNVWWKAVSSVTLGTNSTMIGNILASTSVTMNTGATLNGRAFASTGAVTMDSNTITGLSCLATGTSVALTSGGTSSSYCPPTDYATPVIIESRRVDADSIFLSWGPYSGINTFNVQYGTENGKWLYSTNVTGFSTTLNNLPANTPIWVRIATTDYCSVGEYGAGRLVGGPGLPDTGFAPNEKGIAWYIPAGILVGISALLLIQRKYRFLSGH